MFLSLILYTLSNCGNPYQSSSTDLPQNQPQPSLVHQLHITSLTYDPIGELITCNLHHEDKQSAVTGKYALQVTPHEGTQATIKDASLQNGKYSIDLGTINLAAGKDLIKTFPIQWNDGLVGEFSFQLMRMEDNILGPIGKLLAIKCQQEPLKLVIEHPESGYIKYKVMNVSSKEVHDIVLCWKCQQPTVQIVASGNVLQQVSLGTLLGKAQYVQSLGQLDFGGNEQVALTFWLQAAGNIICSQQHREFTAPATFKKPGTNLFEAINKGDVTALKKLLENPTSPLKIKDVEVPTGHTLLTKAIDTLPPDKRKSFVEVLLQQNELVNLPNTTTKMTPLDYAAEKKDIATIGLLLHSTSMDVTRLDTLKRSPIFWMVDKLQPGTEAENIITLLLNKMQNAVGQEKVQEILNQKDILGHTPLSQAICRRFSLELISSLLEASADPNQFGPDAASPLYGAIYRQDPTLVAALIQYQADVNKKELNGETLLHEVVRHTTKENIGVMKEITQILCKSGAEIDAKNKAGKRPVDLVKETTNLPPVESGEFIQLLQEQLDK